MFVDLIGVNFSTPTDIMLHWYFQSFLHFICDLYFYGKSINILLETL